MSRLGHSTPRAALIYQHATSERDKRIADGLNLMIEGRLTLPSPESTGRVVRTSSGGMPLNRDSIGRCDMALFVALILVAVALGISGWVVKGLFFLLIIGILVFLADLVFGGIRIGRRRGGPRAEH